VSHVLLYRTGGRAPCRTWNNVIARASRIRGSVTNRGSLIDLTTGDEKPAAAGLSAWRYKIPRRVEKIAISIASSFEEARECREQYRNIEQHVLAKLSLQLRSFPRTRSRCDNGNGLIELHRPQHRGAPEGTQSNASYDERLLPSGLS
jgi:hypothetical protein